ncbi:MAG: TFIIB-type zinc ribbon-containing protein [Thermoleophilia bacterium]
MKPSSKEDEYIARMEYERQKQIAEAAHEKLKEQEKADLKELHYMCCPKCGMDLIEIEYHDILIDKCSECEGIWLDDGEIDAIAKMEKTGLDKLFSVFK